MPSGSTRTRFALVLLETADGQQIVGYPEGVTAEVLADVDALAPHVRRDFIAGSDASVRAVGLVSAGTAVTVLRVDQHRVECQAGERVFSTAPSALVETVEED